MEENTNATNNEALEAENVDSQDANAGNDNKIDEILERLAKAEAKVAQAETENEKLKACQWQVVKGKQYGVTMVRMPQILKKGWKSNAVKVCYISVLA